MGGGRWEGESLVWRGEELEGVGREWGGVSALQSWLCKGGAPCRREAPLARVEQRQW